MARAADAPQSTLFPPEALEAVLRVGIVGAGGHVQLQVEVRSATDGTLLELWSRPHVQLSEISQAVVEAADRLVRLSAAHTAPF